MEVSHLKPQKTIGFNTKMVIPALDDMEGSPMTSPAEALRSAHLSKALLAACPWRVATVLWPLSGRNGMGVKEGLLMFRFYLEIG